MADAGVLAGLDIGTTGCKISVFSESGELLGGAYEAYTAESEPTLLHPNAVRCAVRSVLRRAALAHPAIAAVGVTSFGETFALLDEHEEPLMPAMLYTDPHGREECEALCGKLGPEKILAITGLSPAPMYSLPKLMWVRKNRPEIWARVKRIALMQDFITGYLTGTYQIDCSLATRTMAFDLSSLAFSGTMLDAAEVPRALLSDPVPTGTCAGKIRRSLADEVCLRPDTLILSVSHDQVAAAIGSGVLDETKTVDGAGTVECITPVFRRYDPKAMARGSYCIVPFPDGQFVTYAFTYTGGALVSWFAENLAGRTAAQAKTAGGSIYDILEKAAPDAPTGLMVLPHFAGSATPFMDPGSRGAILGLTLAHTEADLYRACMEGVCYEMRLNQEKLLEAGIPLAPLRATGGGAKSRLWMQMKADVLNLPVTRLETPEAGACGSAMLCGIASGAFGSLREAAQAMVREKETFLPRSGMHARYEEIYARYRKLYETVRPLT